MPHCDRPPLCVTATAAPNPGCKSPTPTPRLTSLVTIIARLSALVTTTTRPVRPCEHRRAQPRVQVTTAAHLTSLVTTTARPSALCHHHHTQNPAAHRLATHPCMVHLHRITRAPFRRPASPRQPRPAAHMEGKWCPHLKPPREGRVTPGGRADRHTVGQASPFTKRKGEQRVDALLEVACVACSLLARPRDEGHHQGGICKHTPWSVHLEEASISLHPAVHRICSHPRTPSPPPSATEGREDSRGLSIGIATSRGWPGQQSHTIDNVFGEIVRCCFVLYPLLQRFER